VDVDFRDDRPLGELVASIDEECARIEADGEELTEFMSELMLLHEVNHDGGEHVQNELMQTLGGFHQEYDTVSVLEIGLALWMELKRLHDNARGEVEEDGVEEPSTPSTAELAAEAEGLTGGDSEPDQGESPADIMFQ
jgi:hypothetical protein